MKKIVDFIKKEAMLTISFVLALASLFVVKPDVQYISYIDFRVLALLFCFMVIVLGWQKTGFFNDIGFFMAGRVKSMRALILVLVALCFFSSMVITNDIALITFVPFTISVLSKAQKTEYVIKTVVFETIAANLGSMLTPMGNPQNLYLFSLSKMDASEFILFMLPLTAVSFAMLMISVLFLKDSSFRYNKDACEEKICILKTKEFWVYSALFLICLGNVFRLIPYQAMFVIVGITVLFLDKKLLLKADYPLLLTFVCFFVFIGNISRIEWIKDLLKLLISGREILISVLSSQFMSNVPSAMLLSGFTSDYKALLLGVNIGGLGTLIASMASLISYKYYANAYASEKGDYIKTFTLWNILFLAVLLVLCSIFK
ncbi:MAG: SLC13 family permease [Lachnospiraceae bacterium]|nr:SLC13 family permease [Lachnospiraceae bacterium]